MINIKTKSEVEKLRESNKIVAEFHNAIREEIKIGTTTAQLDVMAEAIAIKYNAIPGFRGYRGFPYAICASKNHEIVHGFPDDKPLEEGTLLSIDFGILKNGFYGDAAITIPIGAISLEESNLIDTTRECLDKAIAVSLPGNFVGDIGNVISTHANTLGFEVIKDFVGHGIGRELHERPPIKNYGNKKEGAKLKEGMVICIEPMLVMGSNKTKTLSDGWTVITADHSKAAHFEHCVHITANGPEILSI